MKHIFFNNLKFSCASVTQSCPNFCDPMAHWLLCPQIFPGMNTGIGCHFLLQGIFLTQGSIKLQSLAVPALASGFFPLNCMGRPGNFLKQLPSPNCYIVPFNDIENLGIFHILFQWAFISFRWQWPQHYFIFCFLFFWFFACLFVCFAARSYFSIRDWTHTLGSESTMDLKNIQNLKIESYVLFSGNF